MGIRRSEYATVLARKRQLYEEKRWDELAEKKRQATDGSDGGDGGDDDDDYEEPLAKGKGDGKGKGKATAAPPPPSLPSAAPPPPPGQAAAPLDPPRPPAETPDQPTFSLAPSSSAFQFTLPTSVQTSFITITQTAKGKGEEPAPTAAPPPPPVDISIDRPPNAPLTVVVTASVTITETPSVEPSATEMSSMSPASGESNLAGSFKPTDHSISPMARNLLVALGILGGLSLLIASGIIFMRRSRKRHAQRSFDPPAASDNPFGSPNAKLGDTTHIIAVPQENPFLTAQERQAVTEKADSPKSMGPKTNNTTETAPKRNGAIEKKGERAFSDALDAFFLKARRSSYNYKIGP